MRNRAELKSYEVPGAFAITNRHTLGKALETDEITLMKRYRNIVRHDGQLTLHVKCLIETMALCNKNISWESYLESAHALTFRKVMSPIEIAKFRAFWNLNLIILEADEPVRRDEYVFAYQTLCAQIAKEKYEKTMTPPTPAHLVEETEANQARVAKLREFVLTNREDLAPTF